MPFPRDYNAASDFIDRHAQSERSGHPAFIEGSRRLSYGALAAQSRKAAEVLTGALGLRREDRVALLLLDGLDYPPLFWGAIRAGVIPVPLNTLLSADQYTYILEDSRAGLVFASAPLLPVWPSL